MRALGLLGIVLKAVGTSPQVERFAICGEPFARCEKLCGFDCGAAGAIELLQPGVLCLPGRNVLGVCAWLQSQTAVFGQVVSLRPRALAGNVADAHCVSWAGANWKMDCHFAPYTLARPGGHVPASREPTVKIGDELIERANLAIAVPIGAALQIAL